MSGGAWDYPSSRFEEIGKKAKAVFDLMAAIEHEMDWAVCGDTCEDCFRKRLVYALEAFFEDGGEDAERAVEILREKTHNKKYMCKKCKQRYEELGYWDKDGNFKQKKKLKND